MKKTINKLLPLAAWLLLGCGNSEEKQATLKPEQIIAQVKEVTAIGKIIPEGGIITISQDESAVVDKILVKVGDTVSKGTVLVQLRAQAEELDVASAAAQVEARQAQNRVDTYEVAVAEALLAELQKRFQTSRDLAGKGAETREVLLSDESAYLQQQQKVAQAKQVLVANRKTLEGLRQDLKKARQGLSDRRVEAPEAGIVLSIDVDRGETLEPNIAFAELAPPGDLMVECEVDELYASKVKKGQRVMIFPTNSTTQVAEGLISYVGASLQDKSILYEKVGEGTDRRVRRVRVDIARKNSDLLINDKVECRILLQ